MENRKDLKKKRLSELLKDFPFIHSFFEENGLDVPKDRDLTLEKWIDSMDEDEREDKAIDGDTFFRSVEEYIEQMKEFLGENDNSVYSLSILPGKNKAGESEKFDVIKISRSEIISIVGPTGSGKSRLLADIEWTAQKDTPTMRKILINDEVPDMKWRFSSSNKLVAQLSQNMNFVIDLTVFEFLELHAKSRMVEDEKVVIDKIIKAGNNLAGEKFAPDTPVTSLSGGQSRALMIADTAILSSSPIVLIDEIENAGIDRKKALELLVGEEKIVLMATHDPLLALMADKRIVINNGGIEKLIVTSDEEREVLSRLEVVDNTIKIFRKKMRYGEVLSLDDF